ELHGPLKPADHLLRGQRVDHFCKQLWVIQLAVDRAVLIERCAYLRRRERGAEIGTLHSIETVIEPARLMLVQMAGRQCGAERATGIPSRRLNPDVAETAVAQDLAVGDTIERNTARDTQIGRSAFARKRARKAQHRLVKYGLNGSCEIHVAR